MPICDSYLLLLSVAVCPVNYIYIMKIGQTATGKF